MTERDNGSKSQELRFSGYPWERRPQGPLPKGRQVYNGQASAELARLEKLDLPIEERLQKEAEVLQCLGHEATTIIYD